MTASSPPRLTWDGTSAGPSRAPLARLTPPRSRADSTPDPGGPPACTLIQGDNLLALQALRDEIAGQVTLAYLDPPFLTGREHFHVQRTRPAQGNIERSQRSAFDDRWDSLGDYLAALRKRLETIRELLAPHGCLVLHVDPKTSHYLKVMCDEIFGIQSFASEVIWRYRRWPAKTKNFQRVHDVMLRYVRDPDCKPRFNQIYEPLAPSTRKTWGDRKQRAITNDSGRRLRSSKTEERSRGTPLGDVWEIGIVAPVAKERTGYPTQKPEALMRRWIEACTDEGDLVLDPYMGSGTTVQVACQMGRRAIGIDVGFEAFQVASERLKKSAVDFATREVLPPPVRAQSRGPAMNRRSAS